MTSLPPVFLSWGAVASVVSIALYSFRLSSPPSFDDHSLQTVVEMICIAVVALITSTFISCQQIFIGLVLTAVRTCMFDIHCSFSLHWKTVEVVESFIGKRLQKPTNLESIDNIPSIVASTRSGPRLIGNSLRTRKKYVT